MKTPRELLLERHKAASPKLDALRAAALPDRRQPSTLNSQPAPWWREWLWPCPRAWAALAAVWVVLFLVNSSERPSRTELARHSARPQMPAPWLAEEQWRLMAELSLLNEPPPKPRPPAAATPQPRSDWTDSARAV
jgi:hypothetical protein